MVLPVLDGGDDQEDQGDGATGSVSADTGTDATATGVASSQTGVRKNMTKETKYRDKPLVKCVVRDSVPIAFDDCSRRIVALGSTQI